MKNLRKNLENKKMLQNCICKVLTPVLVFICMFPILYHTYSGVKDQSSSLPDNKDIIINQYDTGDRVKIKNNDRICQILQPLFFGLYRVVCPCESCDKNYISYTVCDFEVEKLNVQ